MLRYRNYMLYVNGSVRVPLIRSRSCSPYNGIVSSPTPGQQNPIGQALLGRHKQRDAVLRERLRLNKRLGKDVGHRPNQQDASFWTTGWPPLRSTC